MSENSGLCGDCAAKGPVKPWEEWKPSPDGKEARRQFDAPEMPGEASIYETEYHDEEGGSIGKAYAWQIYSVDGGRTHSTYGGHPDMTREEAKKTVEALIADIEKEGWGAIEPQFVSAAKVQSRSRLPRVVSPEEQAEMDNEHAEAVHLEEEAEYARRSDRP